ncbi:MAG: hypothetical protein HY360_04685 [Verrucomicrobia bacterium]|nr:hypothetical protein [Verrucomicrobiota bacterium]
MNKTVQRQNRSEKRHPILSATREHEVAWGAKATVAYGPPDIRARKNQQYVARLIRKHSEATIRGLLKGLSMLTEPKSAANLATRDLDAEPLVEIIQPFELFGFNFKITNVSGSAYTVNFGESYGTCGSGGKFILARTGSGPFHVIKEIEQWIA